MSKYANEEEILRQIRNEEGGELLVKKLFLKYQTYFESFIIKEGCPVDLSKELYIKAFGIFYFKAKEDKITTPLNSNLQTYLNGIGRNLLLQTFTHIRKNKTESLEDIMDLIIDDNVSNIYKQREDVRLTNQILNLLNEKCKKLLSLTFLQDYSDDAIMREMGFKNEGAVRQQRHRCLNKCRELLKIKK